MWHKIIKYGLYLLAGAGTGALLVSFFLLRDSYKRLYRKIKYRFVPRSIPDWNIAMTIRHPTIHRPRFLSLHTLAALTGRSDLMQLAKEMKDSAEVGVTYCTTVNSPVFHLFDHASHSQSNVWNQLEDFLKKYPYPEYKGFKPIETIWSSGTYGIGTYTQIGSAMKDAFTKDDYVYANKIIEAIERHGYEAGMKKYKIKKSKLGKSF